MPGHTARSSGIGHHDLLVGEVRHARFEPSLAFSQIIVAGIYRQAVQPRLEHFRGTKLLEGKIQPEEYLLRHILHILRPTDQARDYA